MLFHIAIFALISNNVFIAAQTQSSCRISTLGDDEECGTLYVAMESVLAGGRAALREEMRWQAGIYTKLTQPYMQVCAGSLVSSKVVISAAHCFWSEGKQLPASDFAIGFGKLYRPWNDPEDAETAQKSDIREIHIPPRYHGSITNYQDDIALLVLATAVEINAYVRSVCLDFDYELDNKQLADGNLGKVAGWGRTDEDGEPSPILQVLNLPAVDVARCYDNIEPAFRPALTSDKICAGRTMEGTAVCMGDSGGGLAFPENSTVYGQRFYLRGVVSTAPRSVNENLCNIYTYATFTHIAKHEQFIREVMLEASKPAPVLQVTTLSVIDPDAPPIHDITSLPIPSEPLLFRPLGEVIAGGKPKPLNKGRNKKKNKKDSIKTETTDSDKSEKTDTGVDKTEIAPNTDDNVTETSPSKSEDTDVFTIQVIEEPSETQTGPSQNTDNDDASQTKPRDEQADADYTVQIIVEPTETKPSISQSDTDAEEYTVQIAEEPTTQTKPTILKVDDNDAVKQTDPDADAETTVKVVEEPTVETKPTSAISESSKPKDEDAESEYTVQIIKEPTVTTDSTKTDQNTAKRPFLSISSEPFLSTGAKSPQTDTSIDNQQIVPTGNQPDKTDDQSDKSIEDQPIQSTSNQQDISISDQHILSEDNQPDQSIGNQPSQPIGDQPSQTLSNQAAQSWSQLPLSVWNQPTATVPNQQPLNIGSQQPQAVDTQTTGQLPSQSTGNQDQIIVSKPITPFGNQLPGQIAGNLPTQIGNHIKPENQVPVSQWNNPVQSSNQPALTTGNPSVLSIGNQPDIFTEPSPIESFGVIGSQQSAGQPTVNQESQFVYQKVQPGNQAPLSQWNNRVQSSNQPAQNTGNPSVFSIGNQPVKSVEQSGIALGVTGNQQSVYFTQSTPSSFTTQKNPDVTFVKHKWNSHSFGYDHHPYDFHHDYHHNHDDHYHGYHDTGHYQGHHDTGHYHGHHNTGHYHNHNPHYHNHHDWHNFNNLWY